MKSIRACLTKSSYLAESKRNVAVSPLSLLTSKRTRDTLLVPSPGCAQLPPAIPFKPPSWPQVTTKISVAPTPPPEPPDPGPRAAPPPLPDSLAASLLAAGKEFISGEPSLMHAKQVYCVIAFVVKVLKGIGPKWVIREFNISLNLIDQTQGNVNVLGKECTTWAGIVLLVLSQFHDCIWFQEKGVLDSPIQGLISLGPIPNPSNPNRKARGFAQSFLTFVFAVPIRSPMHWQIRAMLMTCILLDVEGSVHGGRHIQLPNLFARAFKCGSNAITMGIIVQYPLKWGVQEFGQEFDLHGYYEFVLYCGLEMEPVGEDRNIQIEDESAREYTEEVEIVFSEYFLFGNLFDLIQSLEIFVAPRYAPIFSKKFIILAMNGKNREKEMVSALLSVHIAISSMEDIVSGFVMLLENVTANGVNMLLRNREVAALDILVSSSELASFLARARIDDVLASLNLEESNCRLPSKDSENEAVQQAQSLVIGSSSSQQWDPGKRTWFFNYYRARRVFGQICGGTQERFNLLGIVLQWCFTLVLVAALLCVVAAIVGKLFMSSFVGVMQDSHVKTTLVIGRDKLYSKDSFLSLRLEDKSVFQEGGNVRTQMRVWAQVGLVHQLPNIVMMWQRERREMGM